MDILLNILSPLFPESEEFHSPSGHAVYLHPSRDFCINRRFIASEAIFGARPGFAPKIGNSDDFCIKRRI